jgi:hypothetical protein
MEGNKGMQPEQLRWEMTKDEFEDYVSSLEARIEMERD